MGLWDSLQKSMAANKAQNLASGNFDLSPEAMDQAMAVGGNALTVDNAGANLGKGAWKALAKLIKGGGQPGKIAENPLPGLLSNIEEATRNRNNFKIHTPDGRPPLLVADRAVGMTPEVSDFLEKLYKQDGNSVDYNNLLDVALENPGISHGNLMDTTIKRVNDFATNKAREASNAAALANRSQFRLIK